MSDQCSQKIVVMNMIHLIGYTIAISQMHFYQFLNQIQISIQRTARIICDRG